MMKEAQTQAQAQVSQHQVHHPLHQVSCRCIYYPNTRTGVGAVAGIIGGIMAFLLISAAAIATVLVVVYYYCARKHKRHTHGM